MRKIGQYPEPDEQEACLFADRLLMPKDKFCKAVKETGGDIAKLAAYFQVPTLAIRHRAAQLGYKGHGIDEYTAKKHAGQNIGKLGHIV